MPPANPQRRQLCCILALLLVGTAQGARSSRRLVQQGPALTNSSPGVALAPSAEGSQSAGAAPVRAPAPAGEGSPAAPRAAPAPGPEAATVARPSGVGVETFIGDGTAFSEQVNNTGASFACSMRYLNDWASVHFAAINLPQWDSGRSCGRCATVRCVDPRCKFQNKDVTVMIVDQCPECKRGDLDFSFPVYRDITGMWPHRLTVQWQWADCAPFVNGSIRLWPKDGSNPYWQAFFFANLKYPLRSVRLNGKTLDPSHFQFWQHYGSVGSAPYKLELEAVTGQVLSSQLDDLYAEGQELRLQFDDSA